VEKEVEDHEGRWYLRRVVPYRTRDNKIEGVVLTYAEITQLKTTEIQLRESERMLAEAQHIGHMGSWELDHVNNQLIWSKEILNIFGAKQKKAALNYADFLGYVHPDDRARVTKAFEDSVLNHTIYDVEHRVLLEGNNERYVREICETSYEDGKPIKSSGTVQDITEKKQAELALHAEMEKLERFNKIAVDRELQMVELKKEVNSLLQESGHDKRYVIHNKGPV
jgi:PAS domain S-box-containing protein